ncbi:hypothetical protein FOL47_009671 [Perkinsus chesapeaki]|uniref:Uncharacterized protein n=1 Tax=Perkinsus chesapeaki TaxID=330153 RepID=A0A7J6MRJ4_PERCH|nr:hypothetical protein FOL47_009671 [Perkinsus chesapeaki]
MSSPYNEAFVEEVTNRATALINRRFDFLTTELATLNERLAAQLRDRRRSLSSQADDEDLEMPTRASSRDVSYIQATAGPASPDEAPFVDTSPGTRSDLGSPRRLQLPNAFNNAPSEFLAPAAQLTKDSFQTSQRNRGESSSVLLEPPHHGHSLKRLVGGNHFPDDIFRGIGKLIGIIPWSTQTRLHRALSALYMLSISAVLIYCAGKKLTILINGGKLLAINAIINDLLAFYAHVYLVQSFWEEDNMIVTIYEYLEANNVRISSWSRRQSLLGGLAAIYIISFTILLCGTKKLSVFSFGEGLGQIMITAVMLFCATVVSFGSFATGKLEKLAQEDQSLEKILIDFNALCHLMHKASRSIEQPVLVMGNVGLASAGLIVFVTLREMPLAQCIPKIVATSFVLVTSAALLYVVASVNLKFKHLPVAASTNNFGREIDHDKWCVVSLMKMTEGGFDL